MRTPIVFGLVSIALFSLPSAAQERAEQRCGNGKLSTEVAELAQAVTQRNVPLAPGEKVAPPNGFSVEKLPKTVQDAVRAGTMRINEKAEVLIYMDMPAPIWGMYLNQLSSLGATPQRIVREANKANNSVQTVQALLPITMINQAMLLPPVRCIRLPD
jgi:hypothetical protein